MNRDDGAVEADGLELDAQQPLALHLREDPIENAGFRPAVHAGVDGVPVAKAHWQRSPFAGVLSEKVNIALRTGRFWCETLPR